MPDKTRLGGTKKSRQDPHAAARRELAGRHPRLARLVELAHPIPRVIPDPRPITHLAVRTIVGQLVSTAAAKAIMARLIEAHGTIEGIVVWARGVPHDAPPAHGLSRAKRRAIGSWGEFVAEFGDPRDRWGSLEAEALLSEIERLRGFGPWSAHMLAIFGFGHPRIWPHGDAGVQRVIRTLFPRMKPASVRKLIQGHETHVALCCWTLLDTGRLGDVD